MRISHWYCANFRKYSAKTRNSHLTSTCHLIDRPASGYVGSAEQDQAADAEGEFMAAKGADPVYRLLGTEGLPC